VPDAGFSALQSLENESGFDTVDLPAAGHFPISLMFGEDSLLQAVAVEEPEEQWRGGYGCLSNF